MSHPENPRLACVALLAALVALLLAAGATAQKAPDRPITAKLEANVTVDVGPEEGGKLVYAHIAEGAKGEADGAKLSPIFKVTNNGGTAVTLNQATVEFIGPPFVVPVILDVNRTIAPGATETIHLQNHPDYVEDEDDYDTYNIKLPHPTPPAVNFSLEFAGYALPAEVFRQLAKHQQAYRFPGKKSDVGPGRFWSARSDWISGKHSGNERFAYDVGVREWDPDDEAWVRVEPGTSSCDNESWLIWNQPIYAIADGVVTKMPDWMDGYDVAGKNYFNAVFRPADGAEYQEKWEELTGKGFRTRAVTGYEAGGGARFAALWRKPD